MLIQERADSRHHYSITSCTHRFILGRSSLRKNPRIIEIQGTPSLTSNLLPSVVLMPELSILAAAQHLSDVYGSRPPYYGPQIDPGATETTQTAYSVIPYLIACESRNKDVQEIDSNARGILQFQDPTWADFSQQSGITGDPMNKIDAVQMAIWAVENGYAARWSCAGSSGDRYTRHLL
jgi:hypothetical protein